MRVIAVSTLRAFWERHADAEQPLKAWYEEATDATWTQPADIKAQYRSASVLKNRRVVFNIKGNDYRLAARIDFDNADGTPDFDGFELSVGWKF